MVSRRRRARPRNRPATAQSYAELVRLHIAPKLGSVPLAKLTQHQVRVLLNEKLAIGLSPRRVQMIQGTLRTALQRAMRDDLVHRNVAKLLDPIQVRRPKVRPLTPEQAQAFIAATDGDRHMALYRVTLALGLRRGEALGLRWFDHARPELGGVDLDRRMVYIRQALQRIPARGLTLVDVKTDRSRRDLPLPEIAVERYGCTETGRRSNGACWGNGGENTDWYSLRTWARPSIPTTSLLGSSGSSRQPASLASATTTSDTCALH